MWSALFPALFPATCLGCTRLIRRDDRDRALALCSHCAPEHLELESTPGPDGVVAPFAYRGPLARAVLALKFGGALALAGPLGRLLAVQPWLDLGWDAMVPVPLHWRRRCVRGFDQAEELARWVAWHRREAGKPSPTLTLRVLRRVRATSPQTDLDAHARSANVAGAFRVRRGAALAGRRVLLIDDVTTTGATLRACTLALQHAGAAEVGALALLRTLDWTGPGCPSREARAAGLGDVGRASDD